MSRASAAVSESPTSKDAQDEEKAERRRRELEAKKKKKSTYKGGSKYFR